MRAAQGPLRIGRTLSRASLRQLGISLAALVAAGLTTASAPVAEFPDDPLSLEDRVRCQRRIEEVYWRHRIWPAENPDPKPSLEAVLPDDVLRERVATYLEKSVALEVYWSRPVTGEQLQAELNRMVRDSKNPDLLRELFAALDDDPLVVAECLARPVLVDRLARNWYAGDSRFHGALREKAEAAVAARAPQRALPPLGGYELQSPRGGGCALDTWTGLQQPPTLRGLHAAVWTGTEMIIWGGFDGERLNTGARYDPATDSWTETSTGAGVPTGRSGPSAVWTGTEMIVWGGQDDAGGYANTGGRYDPTADGWAATSTAIGVPAGRTEPGAVWTGEEMIVWGGYDGGGLNTGGRYDPATDSWTATSTGPAAPTPRYNHTVVWTGEEMIVWGGYDGTDLNTGARYSPATDSWTATPTGAGSPNGKSRHTAVWTGEEMIVWGGVEGGVGVRTGGRYDPVTGSWTATSTGAGVPLQRYSHEAIWTGTEMIVWGGFAGGQLNTGGRYDPATDSWTATSTGTGVPAARDFHTAVWTGTEMIVWGGRNINQSLNSGGRYDPATDSWTPTSQGSGAPSGRNGHTAIWTGTEMIVWGGALVPEYLNTGGRYDPATDSWTVTSTSLGVPAERTLHTAVWTGTEMIVWGGDDDMVRHDTGGRYDPTTDSWTATSAATGVPTGRFGHSAIWTGTEMIVWGGNDGNHVSTGGRYDPVSDSWGATSTGDGVPSGREEHQTVWTGTEMIVWGGFVFNPQNPLYTGGRYDPATDSWTPTSNWLSKRLGPSAVWTGKEMVIWGGLSVLSFQYLNTGGRYDPATDSWTATSTAAGVPAGRNVHTAVWTGSEMIVWGGAAFDSLQTGGRYDPQFDSWTGTSTGEGVPRSRSGHTAVWTGNEMIVWGGGDQFGIRNDGGMYCACDGDAVSLWYPDADGDGHGADSTGIPSCSQPPGYIAVGGDCDDTIADTYAGAPEINDGWDNQCPGDAGFGLVDEITGDCGFHNASDINEFSWTAQTGATGYEIARSPDAQFGLDCLVTETPSTSWVDDEPVPSGVCHHYLVRTTQPNVGSWGADSAGVERTAVCP